MPTAAIHNLMATSGPKAASHAFVGNITDNSLSAYSIVNPSGMTLVSELTDATNLANPQAIVIDKSTRIAWLVMSGRLTGVNIANPSSMSMVGSYANANIDGAVAIVIDTIRKIAFVRQGSTTDGGLVAINISNPSSPALLSKLTIGSGTTNSGEAHGLAIDLDKAVVYSTSNGGGTAPSRVRSIDVSNASSMSVLQTLIFTGLGNTSKSSIEIKGHNLFVPHGSGSIASVNATNPASMSVSTNHASMFTGSVPQQTTIYGDVMMLSIFDTNTLRSFNISNPASITVIDTETSATNLNSVRGCTIDLFNGNAYATSETNDRLTSYTAAAGNITQLQSITSGTALNGAMALALL